MISGHLHFHRMSHEEKPDGLSRRNVLEKSVASFGTALVGTSTISGSAAADSDTADVDVTELSGKRRNKARAEALSTRKITLLKRYLVQEGFKPQLNSVVALESRHEGNTWISVRIPFEKEGPYSAYALYSTRDGSIPRAGVVEHHDDENSTWTTLENYAVVDGSVEQVDESSSKDVSREDISIQTSPSLCPQLDKCPDLGCVASLAEAYATEIVACGACVASSGWITWKCAVCVAAIVDGEYPYSCNPCKESACP